jgi:ParB/RepB/Spo0J family partition protein
MDEVNDLAASIARDGLFNEILVRQLEKDSYEIIAGERRFNAFKILKRESIPSKIYDVTESEAHSITAVENLKRKDLRPLETRATILQLKTDGLDRDQIADALSKPAWWISRILRTENLNPEWEKKLSKKEFSNYTLRHIEILSRLNQSGQLEILTNADGSESVGEISDQTKRLGLELSNAPWDKTDSALDPVAGPCSACQFNSAFVPDLFDKDEGIGKDAVCMNRDCWKKKMQAHLSIRFALIEKNKEDVLFLIDKSQPKENLPKFLEGKETLDRFGDGEIVKRGTPGSKKAIVANGFDEGQEVYFKPSPAAIKSDKNAKKDKFTPALAAMLSECLIDNSEKTVEKIPDETLFALMASADENDAKEFFKKYSSVKQALKQNRNKGIALVFAPTARTLASKAKSIVKYSKPNEAQEYMMNICEALQLPYKEWVASIKKGLEEKDVIKGKVEKKNTKKKK